MGDVASSDADDAVGMMKQPSSATQTGELAALAADAFIYGYPLVYNLHEVGRIARGQLGGLPAAPMNAFGHASALAGPCTDFVSVNNDTVYSIGNVDASGGPVRLSVPDTGGRYYVLQFVDAWTNNFAYVGHRATGTAAGSLLLLPPGWEADVPAGARVIRLPTAIATIVGRWAVAGEADLPAVADLQSRLTLTETAAGAGLPQPEAAVPEDLGFFEQVRVSVRAFPPAGRDRVYQQRFEPLGLLSAATPYRDLEAEVADALRAGLAAGCERLETSLT
jgi:hypothetical protein